MTLASRCVPIFVAPFAVVLMTQPAACQTETVLKNFNNVSDGGSPAKPAAGWSATRNLPPCIRIHYSARDVCPRDEAVCASGRRTEYREQLLPAPGMNGQAGSSTS